MNYKNKELNNKSNKSNNQNISLEKIPEDKEIKIIKENNTENNKLKEIMLLKKLMMIQKRLMNFLMM